MSIVGFRKLCESLMEEEIDKQLLKKLDDINKDQQKEKLDPV